MIQSFKDKDTEAAYNEERVPKLVTCERTVARKLFQLASAKSLEDLRSPPGNRLEALQGNREGTYSIRINDRWRICFRWEDGNAYDVEVVDYHRE